MKYSTFNQRPVDQLKQPMFFGESVNVARYDQQRHSIFEKLIEKQISFFWRPEEIDVSKDRSDFEKLTKAEQHIFISNLKYQTLLDSIQGRSPNVAFLPIVSLPELETWIETWSFFETIHSRSYTHILRNLFTDTGPIFDDIVVNEEIKKRAGDISKYYDDLIFHTQLFQTQGLGSHTVNGETYDVTIRSLKKKIVFVYAFSKCTRGYSLLRFFRLHLCFCRTRVDGSKF